MRNFINIRLKGVNNLSVKNAIRHNVRHADSSSVVNDNENILIDLNSENMGIFDSRERFKHFSKMYKEDRKKHNEKYKKKNKRNLRESFSSWSDGVITFSEKIHQDLGEKYTQKELIIIRKEFLKDFEKDFKTNVKLVILHLDEKTPHFHFMFKNFDEKGQSIIWKNNNSEKLSKLQDRRFEHFQKLGMERGIKKKKELIGVRDYKTIKQYHREQEIKLKEIQEATKNEIKKLKDLRLKIKNDIILGKELKKKQYEEISKQQNEYRVLNNKIKRFKVSKDEKLKETLRNEINQAIREIQSKKDLDFSSPYL